METCRFALSRRQRRRTEIPVAVITVLLCGLPWLAGWQLAVLACAIWLPIVLCTVPSGLYGYTAVTADGLRLWTPYRRRFLPWDQITDITVREREDKAGHRKDVLAHRAAGRPIVLPGLRAYRYDNEAWSDFDRRFNTLRSYLYQASHPLTGRPPGHAG